MNVFLVIIGIVLVAIVIDAGNRARTSRLRDSGVYPPPGQGTNADVERLIMMGRKISAIKLYRETNDVDLKMAKEAVEKLTAEMGQRGSTES